jgi:anti-sigma regulatory factor (Ser/Thr protein kinase)
MERKLCGAVHSPPIDPRAACIPGTEARTERVVSDTPAGISPEPSQQEPVRDRSATAKASPRWPRAAERGADSGWLLVLKGGLGAPAQARHEIAERLNGELAAARRQDVVLLVGELVANSVVHANADASREIMIELAIGPGLVHVAVTDEGSSSVPTVRPRSATLEGGRGLVLVEQLSDRWGIRRDGTRLTRVWFEMVRGHEEPA